MSKAKNAAQTHERPVKYEPVPVSPIPCTDEEMETHLRGFITGFIAEEVQDRWLDYLIEKRPLWFSLGTPPRNMKVKYKADALLDGPHFQEEYVHSIEGAYRFPLSLASVYGTALGVYFDLETPPCKMTVAEAATKATEDYSNAIFSWVPGRKAMSFEHEGGVWLCER